MINVLRFALIGASILALTAPGLARHSARAVSATATTPASMHRGASAPVLSGTDWDARVGFDRASSPFGHGGY